MEGELLSFCDCHFQLCFVSFQRATLTNQNTQAATQEAACSAACCEEDVRLDGYFADIHPPSVSSLVWCNIGATLGGQLGQVNG